jgi:gliding motility-associated lipoprotein GldH
MKILSTFFLGLVLLTACKEGVVYSSEIKITDASWSYGQKLNYTWDIQDTSLLYDIILTLNHRDDLKYHNLYTKIVSVYPDSTKFENILSLELFSPSGKPLGKCTGSNCTTPILLQEKVAFNKTGKYTIELWQNSRDSVIQNISSIAIEISKSQLSK